MNKALPDPEVLAGKENERQALKKIEAITDPDMRMIWKRLAPKAKRLILLLVSNPDVPNIENVRRAGYNCTSETKASGFIERVKGPLGKVLENFDFCLWDLGKKTMEFLNAERTVYINVPDVDKESGKITGYHVEARTTPDYPVQLKIFQMLMKYGYQMPVHKVQVDQRHTHTLNDSVTEMKQRAIQAESGEIPAEYEVVTDDSIN